MCNSAAVCILTQTNKQALNQRALKRVQIFKPRSSVKNIPLVIDCI